VVVRQQPLAENGEIVAAQLDRTATAEATVKTLTWGDRRGFEGRILKPGDRVYDKFVGKPDPTESTSRFPVLYLPDEVDEGLCRCGCGETVSRGEWVQGHDQRAIHARIRKDFNGSVSKFIDWYDAHGPASVTTS
jgi:hypothetical protein